MMFMQSTHTVEYITTYGTVHTTYVRTHTYVYKVFLINDVYAVNTPREKVFDHMSNHYERILFLKTRNGAKSLQIMWILEAWLKDYKHFVARSSGWKSFYSEDDPRTRLKNFVTQFERFRYPLLSANLFCTWPLLHLPC